MKEENKALLKKRIDEALTQMLGEAYNDEPTGWISPGAKEVYMVRSGDNGQFHIDFIVNHPSLFGDLAPFIKHTEEQFRKEHAGSLIVDTSESDEIMEKVYQQGWVRYYVVPFGEKSWRLSVYGIQPSIIKTIEAFAHGLVTKQYADMPDWSANNAEVVIRSIFTHHPAIKTDIDSINKGMLEEAVTQNKIRLVEAATPLPTSKDGLAAWVSPDASKWLPVRSAGGRMLYHVEYVIDHPQEFGLKPTSVRAARNQQIVDTQEGDEVMLAVFEKGWIRVMFYSGHWSFTVDSLRSAKTKLALEKLAQHLTVGSYPNLPAWSQNSDLEVTVSTISYEPTQETTIYDIAHGQLEEHVLNNKEGVQL